MNTTASTQDSVAVTLSRQEKEKLLQQMYHVPLWIELIRLFGYKTLSMEQARNAIKPLAEKYGKEHAAAACEVLVDISTQESAGFARLKPHIRRMAFQILGPEPSSETTPVSSLPDRNAPKPRPPSATPKRTKRPVPARDSIMDRYHAAKEKHPGMLLLFRIGDFYELFGEHAETAHKLLGLTLTTRDRTLPMVGFPHHQLEAYLHKLLQQGQRVAICEPVEESQTGSTGKREVHRIVTPANSAETDAKDAPIRQPRHFVVKQCESWFSKSDVSFVSIADAKRGNPALTPYVGVLDFIVLRGEEKLLVTVRPDLQVKHLRAVGELQKLFGPEYKPVRFWPNEGAHGWIWREYSIDVAESAMAHGARSAPKRSPKN